MVRDLIEARLESETDNPSGVSREGTPKLGECSRNDQTTPTMSNRVEMEDEHEFRPRTTRVGGRRDLPTYNGREDPIRYLARYKLACIANNEGT